MQKSLMRNRCDICRSLYSFWYILCFKVSKFFYTSFTLFQQCFFPCVGDHFLKGEASRMTVQYFNTVQSHWLSAIFLIHHWLSQTSATRSLPPVKGDWIFIDFSTLSFDENKTLLAYISDVECDDGVKNEIRLVFKQEFGHSHWWFPVKQFEYLMLSCRRSDMVIG